MNEFKMGDRLRYIGPSAMPWWPTDVTKQLPAADFELSVEGNRSKYEGIVLAVLEKPASDRYMKPTATWLILEVIHGR